jgi:hypothetical protein
MPQTPTYGFEFETPQSKPGITLTGDIDGSSPILAEQVETVIAGIDARVAAAEGDIAALQVTDPGDTGWLTLSTTAAAGFTLTSAVYRLWGPIVGIRVEYERTGGNITADSQGNVGGDPQICTINTVEARPSQQQLTVIHSSLTSGMGTLSTAGVLNLTDMHSSSSILTGHFVRMSGTFFGSTFS